MCRSAGSETIHPMINRKTLIALAFATLVLTVVGSFVGEDNDVLWILDDIIFFGWIGCLLALVGLSVAALARSLRTAAMTRVIERGSRRLTASSAPVT